MTENLSDIGVIFEALSFAVKAHGRQKRKGGKGEPYIAHLIEVARLLWQTGGIRDTGIIIAGILHDTVEDTEVTADQLSEQFGNRVTGIVLEVTDDPTLTKHERRRKQVEHAGSLSESARLIKLADKLSNISDILESPPIHWSVAERLAYVNWGKEVFDRIRGTNEALETAFDELYHRAIRDLDTNSN